MKSRFSMTLDPELVKKIDRLIDGSQFKNRSQTIEHLLKTGLARFTQQRSALILSGGFGSRLRPLTFVVPKPMLPIGLQPLLEHTINYLRRYELEKVILAVGYLNEQIVRYFSDGQRLGIRLQYCFEKEPLDTAGAVKNAQSMLDSDFFVLNGDVIFDSLDLDQVYHLHKINHATATMVITRRGDTSRFGVVEVDQSNRVVRFVEKPSTMSGTPYVNAGVYVFSPNIFSSIERAKKLSLEKNVFPKMVRDGSLFAYKYDGYWSDLGTPEDYLKVQRDLMTGALKPFGLTITAS